MTKEQRQLIKIMQEVRILADMIGLPCSKNAPTSSDKTAIKPGVSEFHANEIYKYYPKKIGKKKGVAKLTRLFQKKPGEFERVSKSLNHYIEYVQDQNQKGFELNYKNFDTWVNSWDDFIDPPETLSRARARLVEKKRLERLSRPQAAEIAEPKAKISPEEFQALKNKLAVSFTQD